MLYTLTIDINLPRKRVIELFDNTDNLKEWQPGLQKTEHLSGEPGQAGAKMKMYYKMGKREIEMIETITVRDLPEKFHGTYDANGVHNIQKNYFIELDDQTTQWKSICEFQFNNFTMKVMGWLMPGAFKKQSYKYMEQFKRFAENAA